jgi:hypothetical protein
MKLKMPKFSLKLPKIKIYGIDVVKNFLFFTLFIVITLFFIGLIISPTISTFKKAKNQYYKTKYHYDVVTKEYKEKLAELNKLKNKNKKVLNAMKRDFDVKNFKLFCSYYLNVKSLKEVNSSNYQNDFVKTTYIMDSTIKSPKNFYDFISALKNYKAILRVYFPIDFVKNKENINLTLKLEHYRLKEAKNALEKAH